MTELIAKRYAKALLEVADKKKINEYVSRLTSIAHIVNYSKVKEFIGSPLVKSEEKVSFLLELLGKKPDSVLANLIRVMGAKGRLSLIPDLVNILTLEMKKESNNFLGTVESSKALGKAELSKLGQALSRYSGANIELKQVKSNLDGIKAEVEDLGLELNVSKDRVKESLFDYIQKAF